MIIVEACDLQEVNGKIRIKSPPPRRCKACGEWLKMHDYRERKARDITGKTVTYSLRRLRCANCGTIQTEIPNNLLPHKHYDAESVSNPELCAADDSTIRRWRR